MKLLCLCAVLVACGGDDQPPPADAANVGPTYDLSCLGNAPTSAPSPIHLAGTLADLTNVAAPVPVANTQVRVIADGGSQLASGTTDAQGDFSIDVPSGGQPVRAHLAADATGFAPARQFTSIPLDASFIQRGGMAAFQQSRVDAIASTLGVSRDAAKGSLEVCIADCALQPFAGAKLAISGEPQLAWAMAYGANMWMARDTTLTRPTNWVCSIAATVNVSSGSHTLTITSGSVTLGPFAFEIEAGTHSNLVVWPGLPVRF